MKNELLLPVGNMDMCLAAIHYGADAVYMGVPFFNARGRTTDFSLEDLKEMIDLCHLYGVKVNLAFNVVIFQDEFPKVIELLESILPMGPDAFIVQDLGLAKLIRAMAPNQRIHASTQMTVTNADAIKLVDDLGIDRFVLGRENSLSEIKLIADSTKKELEVFVHGALCVAYSGQCFTSESLGGRSANRGQCAQSCRLEYELYVDDVKKDLGDKKFLVSPKDLMGIAEIPALMELGVHSFKVEGRLKTPQYVALAAKNYREVLDGAPVNAKKRGEELATAYSRGFFSGWLNGVDHQRLVDGTYSSHRGLEVGAILEVKKKTIIVSSSVLLKAGMGLLFVSKDEKGSKIFEVHKIGANYEVELVTKNLNLEKGEKIYLNSNEPLHKEIEKGWLSREHQKRIPLNISISGKLGEKLFVEAVDPEGRRAQAESGSLLLEAAGRPLSDEFVLDEISSLGTTVYKVGTSHIQIGTNLFLNHKEIKELRRKLVSNMNEVRLKRDSVIKKFSYDKMDPASGTPGINILLRTKKQVESFAESFSLFASYKELIKSVILDFEFGKDYAPSVEMIKSLGLKAGIATTRILKPSEYYNLNIIIRCNPDLILVRNLGAIEYLKSKCTISLIGDFSFNITNSISFDYILSKGLESVNVSYDLNQTQLFDMVDYSDTSRMEVTLHQYMPEFHMEHCVFAAFMSNGSSFKDCGKPCEKHEVKLKDPYGNMHFLKADQECRNTFFKATPQSASFLLNTLKEKGVSTFRLEALDENAHELELKVLTYLKLLKGEISSEQAMSELRVVESYGLGLGQMNKSDTYKDRKKLTTKS